MYNLFDFISLERIGLMGIEQYKSEIERCFEDVEKVRRVIPDYVYREEQVNLSRSIIEVFEREEFLLAEAGTGIGKSYAYLIPAILWTAREKSKVVVSTKTKALQQQIVEKDIPNLRQVLDLDFTYAEAKGRENFLCWNKYMEILAGKKKLEKEEVELVEAILWWAEKTATGDRKELMLENRLLRHWRILAADRDSCRKEACPYQEKCFRLKMMKKLQKADIIITNHALLLSDILVDNKFLPEYEYLIIDEAHGFDREAFDKLAISFIFDEIKDVLNVLYIKDRRFEKGYLAYLKRSFPVLNMFINEIEVLVERAISLTEKLHEWFNNWAGSFDDLNFSKVLKEEDKKAFLDEDFYSLYIDWHDILNLLVLKVENLKEQLNETDESLDLGIIIENLVFQLDKAFAIFEEDMERSDKIVWIEFNGGKVRLVASSPLYIGDILYNRLYKKMKALVMVSATLAVENDFSYFVSKSGLNFIENEGKLNTLIENSPFTYKKQALLYVIEDMPMPDSVYFNKALSEVVLQIIEFIPGRILLLFTSRRQMREASQILRPLCESKGIRLLVQNEDGESGALVNEYISSPNAILMGLDTFWEGIDLKGELLKCLVITKLPFRSPDEPFARALSLYFTLQGQNSFKSFMLPDAVIRFKQGVGRLIRSEQDKGLIIVLDSRMEKKVYGTTFKKNIPITNIQKIKKEELKNQLEKALSFLDF
ncbi:helicase C-terminal domain-containing protein [Thermosyntropha sp.]|uniref:ATP-dependent DNA helicase n=1 Tax=Thermosyntropha sp. TaxID=2740820 RepID=UPI0025CF016A|nr:helicase C-terminal domain-containing protein [Thermosyntropha sp.]MBO8158350.1 DEAD/DEAH box helicase [Thermosyntropha sp.]